MLHNNILKSVLTGGILAITLGAAQAAPITFTFGGSSTATSFIDLGSGLVLTVGAGGYNVSNTPKIFGAQGTVSTNSVGLGVNLNAQGGSQSAVNSAGNTSNANREAISFSFGSSIVKLLSATFADYSFGSTLVEPLVVFEKVGVDLQATTGNTTTAAIDTYTLPGTASTTTTVVNGASGEIDLDTDKIYLGSLFAFGAKAGSSFYVSSITVDYTPPAAVPVPAAGLLLGSALLLPLLRRKRRS